jgi:hypothetical protein
MCALGASPTHSHAATRAPARAAVRTQLAEAQARGGPRNTSVQEHRQPCNPPLELGRALHTSAASEGSHRVRGDRDAVPFEAERPVQLPGDVIMVDRRGVDPE